MVFLIYINAGLASESTGITHKPTDVDKIHNYFEMLGAHAVSPFLFPPSTLGEIEENIKRGVA